LSAPAPAATDSTPSTSPTTKTVMSGATSS
jgi:hypothetical protein